MPPLRRLSLIILAFVTLSEPAYACHPCVTRSLLDQTVRQSDAIVLVLDSDRTSREADSRKPELLELTVLKIYKGSVDTDTVLVRSWYGECAYGVQMRLNTQAVLFLQEARDVITGAFDGTYKLVEDGCSQGQLEVKGSDVRVNDKWITLSDLLSNYINKPPPQ